MAIRPQKPRNAERGADILPWAQEVDKYIRLQGYKTDFRRPSSSRVADYRKRYSFQVELVSNDNSANDDVIVRCGRWTKYRNGSRYDVDMTADVGTSNDPDDVKTLEVPSANTFYVVLTVNSETAPSSLVASLETVYPTEAEQTTLVIASFAAAADGVTGYFRLTSKVLQLWRGGWYWDGFDDSSIIIPPGNVTPDDMDPGESPPEGSGWPDWIDEQLHDHEDHTFQSDDHTGTAGGASELDRYIRHNGDALRNNMSGVIGDGSGLLTIDPTNRQLADTAEVASVDWLNRQAFDSAAGVSIDWDSRNARDSSNVSSIDWETRTLDDSSGTGALSWQNRQLDDSMGVAVANWDTDGFKVQSGYDYYHAGNQGATVTNWASGGIVYGSDVQTYTIRVIPAGGGSPIEIEVLGRPI